MKYFDHINAKSLEEAAELLRSSQGTAKPIAGGTDLLGVLKARILPVYPEIVVNLKTIQGQDYIKSDAEGLKVGALAKLSTIAESEIIREKCPSLAQAAKSVASPLIRNIATIGGNICQDVRCWYYRYPDEVGGAMMCLRKGGELCYAQIGENRYHSIFGGMKVNDPPCMAHCPGGTNIPGYMSKLRAGDIAGAARIILEVNPIPAITARVCQHFCQEGCGRNACDENVSTGAVERFVGDYILAHSDELITAPALDSGKRVAIVGAGPAGLSAAYFLRQAGHVVTIYDKMEEAGGLLTYAIPAYRLPRDYVQRTVAAFEKIGIQFRLNTEVGVDIAVEEIQKQYDCLFFDTGAWKRPIIGIEGEELTTFGLEFLIEVKKWMKDKPGKDVLVIGGGNVAVDVAITAKRLGTGNVTMVCLESEKELPANKEEINRAREEGITLLPQWGPVRVLRDNGKVTALELKYCSSVFDANGKFAPVYDENVRKTITGDSILMAVGQRTDLSFLGKELALEINRGLIAVDPFTQMTSNPGVFAGGEVASGPSTVVHAVKSGRTAAIAINEYLGTSVPVCSGPCADTAGRFLRFDVEGALKPTGVKLPERPVGERSVDVEDTLGLEWDEVMSEAKRCKDCGCLAVNASDIGTVLVSLDANIKTTKRSFTAEEFFSLPKVADVLDSDELVTEILVPANANGRKATYDKFRLREAIDFAIVAVAFAYDVNGGKIMNSRIVLGGVAPVPLRARAVEEYLEGKNVSEEVAAKAAELAAKKEDLMPLEKNGYKIQVLKTLVKRAILNAS